MGKVELGALSPGQWKAEMTSITDRKGTGRKEVLHHPPTYKRGRGSSGICVLEAITEMENLETWTTLT